MVVRIVTPGEKSHRANQIIDQILRGSVQLPMPLLDANGSSHGDMDQEVLRFEERTAYQRAKIKDLYSAAFGSEVYNRVMELHYAAQRRILARLHHHIEFPIVDLGCGTGKLIGMLLAIPELREKMNQYAQGSRGPIIIGVDLNGDNIRQSHAYLSGFLDSLGRPFDIGYDCQSRIALICSAFEELSFAKLRFNLRFFAQTVFQSYVMHWAGGGVQEDEQSLLALNARLLLSKKRVAAVAYQVCREAYPEHGQQAGRLFTFEEYPLHVDTAELADPALARHIRSLTSPVTLQEHTILLESVGFKKESEQYEQIDDVHGMTGCIWTRGAAPKSRYIRDGIR